MRKRNNPGKTISFSKSEFRGLLILFVIIAILFIIRYNIHRENQGLQLAYQQEDSVPQSEFKSQKISNKHAFKKAEVSEKTDARPVDPNTAGYRELLSIGLPAKAAKCILAYRKKGGKFSNPEDLRKIYGIDSALFFSIRQQILITHQHETVENRTFSRLDKSFEVDLNHADTSELIKLPGIGHKLSVRIIKYREALGGFYSTDQLTEVYGISDSLYRCLTGYLMTDTVLIHKINLNRVSLEELQRHPYLNHYYAKAILGYRRLVGPFTKADELINNFLIPEENYAKISPYLLIE